MSEAKPNALPNKQHETIKGRQLLLTVDGGNFDVTRLAASLEGPLNVKRTLALILYWMRSVNPAGFLVND